MKRSELGIVLEIEQPVNKKILKNLYEQEGIARPDWQDNVYGGKGLKNEEMRFKILKKMIEKCKGDSFIDVGCETGFYNRQFKFQKNIGIDISKNKINIARKKSKGMNIKYFVGDIDKIPFNDNSFDIVLSSETLEHVMDPVHALNELMRITKNYLIISVPTCGLISRITNNYKLDSSLEVNSGHLHVFLQSKIKKYLKKNNFEIVDVAGFYAVTGFYHCPFTFPFNRIGDWTGIRAKKITGK